MKAQHNLFTGNPTAELWKVLEIHDIIIKPLVSLNRLCICELKYTVHNIIHNIPLQTYIEIWLCKLFLRFIKETM